MIDFKSRVQTMTRIQARAGRKDPRSWMKYRMMNEYDESNENKFNQIILIKMETMESSRICVRSDTCDQAGWHRKTEHSQRFSHWADDKSI